MKTQVINKSSTESSKLLGDVRSKKYYAFSLCVLKRHVACITRCNFVSTTYRIKIAFYEIGKHPENVFTMTMCIYEVLNLRFELCISKYFIRM